MHWQIKGGASRFFHCHAVFGKKNLKIIQIWGLAHPPQENPGSSTAKSTVKLVNTDVRTCELKNMIDMI